MYTTGTVSFISISLSFILLFLICFFAIFIDIYYLCASILLPAGWGVVVQGLTMKKILFTSFMAIIVSASAMADGVVSETETITTVEVVEYNYDTPRYVSSVQVVPHKRPCAKRMAAKPVRVKTHTEVIDHYQLYQPVTVYQPAGRTSERRIIRAPQTCKKCF